MAVTLTNDTAQLDLPDALHWQDEFGWTPIDQTRSFALDGALVIQEWPPKQAGRPITLGGRAGVLDRATLDTLRGWLSAAGDLTLNWRGTQRSVRWRQDEQPIEAVPLLEDLADPAPEDLFRVTLRFVEV